MRENHAASGRCGVLWCVVWSWCGVVWCNVMWFSVVCYGVVWYGSALQGNALTCWGKRSNPRLVPACLTPMQPHLEKVFAFIFPG